MQRLFASLFVIFFILGCTLNGAAGRPTDTISRQKRQSDQRLAELETLLALQKYRHHRLRPNHKQQPGYGIIDFSTIGRRKKSLRFSPGESRSHHPVEENRLNGVGEKVSPEKELVAADPSLNEKIDRILSYKSLLIRNQDGDLNSQNAQNLADTFGAE